MRPHEGESYESWAERAKMYEHGVALQRIATGEDPEKVMEEMSRRLMEKLLHPLYTIIREQNKTEYDSEKSKQEYAEKYLKHRTPVADHVEGVLDKL